MTSAEIAAVERQAQIRERVARIEVALAVALNVLENDVRFSSFDRESLVKVLRSVGLLESELLG